MEIFRCIVNNRILRKWVMLTTLICLCANLGIGAGFHDSFGIRLSKDVLDAVSGNSELPQQAESVIHTGLEATCPNEGEDGHVLRLAERTRLILKLVDVRRQETFDWDSIHFDLHCKSSVREGVVRGGIFHLRLQSDDEEAPENLTFVA